MSSPHKPTGRRRYRVQRGGWFRTDKLVLQVEVAGYETDFYGGYIDRYAVRYWRDAQIEDLTVTEAAESKA